MRILFIGTGDIGLPSFNALLAASQHTVVGVVTQPDKPAGRGQKLTASAIKLRALQAGIEVHQPLKIRNYVAELAALKPDIAVVIAYGQILSKAVLEVPRLGCLNVHASLLPLYRGAAPIQAAIRAGDAETGVTIMHMDEGLDTGDSVLMARLALRADHTGGVLHDELAELAPMSLLTALDLLAAEKAPRTVQDDAQASHVGKLTREHGRLDWARGSVELERLVRAYNPWPGTFTTLPDGSVLKVHAARIALDQEGAAVASGCPMAGTIIAASPKQGLLVATGDGVLELMVVQSDGGKRLPVRDFLAGHRVEVGARLGDTSPP
jgi:methionyl-tRNA formyltransferase